MKKTILLLALTFMVLSNAKADLIIDNFDTKTIGQTLPLKAWYTTDGTGTVVADPTNASNKVVNIVTTNWDAIMKLTVTLPSGKTLADYTGFSFDIYIGTNANDANPNYKNMFVYLDDVKKYENTDYPKQADVSTWTTKTFLLSSLNLTPAELAKTTFTIAFGISTDKGNYFVDNVKLAGGGTIEPPVSGSFIISDFSSQTIGQTLPLKAWYTTDGTGTVAADPTNASNKVVNIVTTNWDAIMKLTVTLPAGKKLADYDSFSFDIYFPTNANDANANYKNMFVYIDDVKKYEDTAYPKQAEMLTWTTKTFTISSLNLTAAEGAKTTFTIAFGVSTDKGNYFVDNAKLNGGGTVTPPVSSDVIFDFNSKTIGQTETMKAWYTTDGTATIAADPTNAGNKAVNIVTTNWDAILKLNVTLPSGITLANYESLAFDIYIPTNANDANPNYNNMFVYLDDVKKYENTDYPKQAEVSTWTTKTFSLVSLALTPTELAKSTFALAFGMSTDKGNYFIDNVKLIGKTTGVNQTKELSRAIFIAGNMLYVGNEQAEKISVYDIKGSLLMTDQNKSVVDVSILPKGIYIAKVQIGGNTFTNKVIK